MKGKLMSDERETVMKANREAREVVEKAQAEKDKATTDRK
jgi:hypothetical protein